MGGRLVPQRVFVQLRHTATIWGGERHMGPYNWGECHVGCFKGASKEQCGWVAKPATRSCTAQPQPQTSTAHLGLWHTVAGLSPRPCAAACKRQHTNQLAPVSPGGASERCHAPVLKQPQINSNTFARNQRAAGSTPPQVVVHGGRLQPNVPHVIKQLFFSRSQRLGAAAVAAAVAVAAAAAGGEVAVQLEGCGQGGSLRAGVCRVAGAGRQDMSQCVWCGYSKAAARWRCSLRVARWPARWSL